MASFTHANYSFSYPVNGVAENCRQAAAQQGPWGMMPNGMVVQQQQWVQQNGQTQMSRDLQRPTSFTNGRKRSRENIECEEMKKAKTEMETQFLQMQQGFINQGFSNVAIAQHQMQLQMQQQQQQQGFNSCFPSSLIEHQSLMRAERQYDGSILASLVAEAHGC